MPPPLLWTRPHRAIILTLTTLLLALLAFRYYTRPTHLPDTLPDDSPRAQELSSQLDPNTATWQQLALLPNLGEKKAQAIISYRNQYKLDHPNQIPFLTPTDLTNIKGIGDTTVTNLTPYLTFPIQSEDRG
ncbi:MAG TPA: helix-hairpin-helix domain-containing protein [Tepidisphaeraceae bacterium]|jgi:hypothetical protein|nr:helix-hairpin-helix domain-containing protein [Tepidisphaeraceae bacterium]